MRTLLIPPVVVFMSIGLMILLHLKAPVLKLMGQPFNWLGIVLILAGFIIASWHARLFKRIGTNINTFDEPGKLTREGLFRKTRNPMYLGMVIFLMGVAFTLGSLATLVGPAAFFLLAHFWYIPFEERAMNQKFGSDYTEYKNSVPRWF